MIDSSSNCYSRLAEFLKEQVEDDKDLAEGPVHHAKPWSIAMQLQILTLASILMCENICSLLEWLSRSPDFYVQLTVSCM